MLLGGPWRERSVHLYSCTADICLVKQNLEPGFCFAWFCKLEGVGLTVNTYTRVKLDAHNKVMICSLCVYIHAWGESYFHPSITSVRLGFSGRWGRGGLLWLTWPLWLTGPLWGFVIDKNTVVYYGLMQLTGLWFSVVYRATVVDRAFVIDRASVFIVVDRASVVDLCGFLLWTGPLWSKWPQQGWHSLCGQQGLCSLQWTKRAPVVSCLQCFVLKAYIIYSGWQGLCGQQGLCCLQWLMRPLW